MQLASGLEASGTISAGAQTKGWIVKIHVRALLRWLTLVALLSAPPLASAYYDPGVQRWINRDPLGDSASGGSYYINQRRLPTNSLAAQKSAAEDWERAGLYTFVGNCPTRWIDPLGLKKDPACAAACWAQYDKDVKDITRNYAICMAAGAAACMDAPAPLRPLCFLSAAAACGAYSIAAHTAAASRLAGCISGCNCLQD
jgi:hypothetical protein